MPPNNGTTNEGHQTETGNITDAIDTCVVMRKGHHDLAIRILGISFTISALAIAAIFLVFFLRATGMTDIPDFAIYAFLAVFTLTFSVLMAIYRLHLNELNRLQQQIVGFSRIRVAGANSSPGYQSEVREALTSGAFDFGANSKKGKLDSLVPGHPTSDLTAAAINKILEHVEVVPKKGKSTN